MWYFAGELGVYCAALSDISCGRSDIMTYILASCWIQNRTAKRGLQFEEWPMVLSWLASDRQYAEAGSGRIVRCSNIGLAM